MIRKAEKGDIPAIVSLLGQILALHHAGRPDLFRATGSKYSPEALEQILATPETPVFVYEQDGRVAGYIMCQEQHACGDALQPVSTLYIDDLCVDVPSQGKGIGRELFQFARAYAQANGFHNITLHAWACNPAAMAFYEAMGLQTQYTCLEWIVEQDRTAR